MKINTAIGIFTVALLATSSVWADSVNFNTKDMFGLESGGVDVITNSLTATINLGALDANLAGASFDITLTDSDGNDVEFKTSNSTYGIGPGGGIARVDQNETLLWTFSNFAGPTDTDVTINFTKITGMALASVNAGNNIDYWLNDGSVFSTNWTSIADESMDISAANLKVVEGDTVRMENTTADWMRVNSNMLDFKVSYNVIPEPASISLIALVGGGMLWIRKRRRY
jgi:hypothetical protein